MKELIHEMFTPAGILFLPLLIGLFGSLTFGVIGSYVTARKITYIATAIGHSVLAGIGFAAFLQHHYNWSWCTPLLGGIIVAIPAALIIGIVILKANHRADSVISAVMAMGMAIGLLFIYMVPGVLSADSILFGDILMVDKKDFITILITNIVIVVPAVLFYHKLLAVCFDEEFARLRGLHADFYFLMLLVFTALTIVVMMQVIGIIMVVALLTLPSLAATLLSRKLWQNMAWATIICMICVIGGLAISYHKDLPSGPVIVLFSGGLYLILLTTNKIVTHIK